MKPYKLNEDWRINSDSYQFILEKRKIVQKDESENKGEERWSLEGYYSSIGAALSSLAKKTVLTSTKDITSLTDELRDIKEIGRELDKKLVI